jgi:hypothetical protein
MMAYLSNSIEAYDWQLKWCDHCVHRPNLVSNPPADCPILMISELFNYDQLSKGKEELKTVLDILIPTENKLFAGRCSMYVEGLPLWLDNDDEQEDLFVYEEQK